MNKQEPDVVVQEVPVFLSNTLNGQLCLLQYPLTPCQIPFQDELSIMQVQIKPRENKIQLKVELDTGRRYDKAKGEFYQNAAIGKTLGPDTNSKDGADLLIERSLVSAPVPVKSRSPRYVIGLIRDGRLHLTPLLSTVKMENKCWYLTSSDRITNSAKEIDGGGDDDEVADVESTKITLRFKQTRGANREDGLVKAKNPYCSYSQAKANEALEPWTELEYFHRKENEEHLKLQSNVDESQIPFLVMDKTEYLRELFPMYVETQVQGTQSLFNTPKPSGKITGKNT